MKNQTYDFADPTVPSLATILSRVAADPAFPQHRRGQVLSSLHRFAIWAGAAPETFPFAPRVLRVRLAALTPGGTGRSKKRLQNVRSDVNYVMRHYALGGGQRYLAPLTPAWTAVRNQLRTKYEVCSLSRAMQYASAKGIRPDQFDDHVSDMFLTAMKAEEVLKDPQTVHKNAIRAWNLAHSRYPSWPRRRLAVPVYRTYWGSRWSAFSPNLEREVDTFLSAGQHVGTDDLFSDDAPIPALRPSTVRTQKDHLRLVATILAETHLPTTLADLCRPTAFKSAIRAFLERHGSGVTAYIAQIAWTITKVARHSGCLGVAQIKEVDNLFRKVTIRKITDARGRSDRDQDTLDQLDDPRKMDVLLSLPSLHAERIIKSGRKRRRDALEIQKALALELWLCAPLRISNFVALDLDRHIARVAQGGKNRFVIRIPAEEVKNKEPLEHFLHNDAIALLNIYTSEYLPQLLSGPTRWLFPGENNRHKDPGPFRLQMNRFLKEHTGIDFHPHLIRKIVTKICLDDDPGAIEIARRCLGHSDERTTRKAYTQKQNRAAHECYLNALEGRRLAAFKHYDR